MKKYIQITVVLGIFGLLLLIKQLRGSEEAPIINNSNTSQPTSSAPTPTSASGSSTNNSSSTYKDGTYTGPVTDAFYGNVQVQVTISSGKITDVQFLQYPNDASTSREINSQAMPLLRQEAITAQSSSVDVVSGASQTSGAFQQSLSGALQKAS